MKRQVESLQDFKARIAAIIGDKPILFLDTDDLIAMQEGRDVLAKAFANSSPDTGS